ncbi:MAG: shikimate dehydrogenase family protein [Daejeonella sp.]|uniref:shikimate dehydrogenase family protein n=1 Tax=Daejeonella sp. JGW-45 TaxID=3034148 RepID=UPI0023EC6E4E|nr:shikimate dehydrogenase [Daejeonella sp. JGW-45]
MKKYGLIGYPLTHSFSKKYFSDKFAKEGYSDREYELYPIQNLSDLPELINDTHDLCGLNVTVPHKIGVMFYLDKIDPAAKEIDAVNCIKIVNHQPVEAFFSGELSSMKVRLEGYNTDAFAFEASLKPLLKKHHQKALILGNGGAARAVAYVLGKLDISYRLVSRRAIGKQLKYKQLTADVMKERLLIINTTPLGTAPNIEECPDIPYDLLTSRHLLYDLVYNPAETEFLKRGKEKGAAIKNGLEMLHLQAEKSWEIWNS